MMMKFGILPKIPIGISPPSLSSLGQGTLPPSLQSGMGMTSEPSRQNTAGNLLQLATKLVDQTSHDLTGDITSKAGSTSQAFTSKSSPLETSFASRTEKVVTNFLQDLTSIDGGNEVM